MVGGVSSSLKDLTVMGPRFWAQGMVAKFGPKGTIAVPISGVGMVHVRTRDSDFTTLRQVFRDREYEIAPPHARKAIADHYSRIVASGNVPVIIDAGANIGAASMWFRKAYPEAQIIAVEPDPGNAAVLRRNCGERMVLLEAAIGGEPGFVEVIANGRSWGSQTERASKGVPIVTVDQIAQMIPNSELFIAKIDIEGFESDLFNVNTGWIDRVPVIIVEPHDWLTPGTSRSFQREMGRRDYDLLINGENLIYIR